MSSIGLLVVAILIGLCICGAPVLAESPMPIPVDGVISPVASITLTEDETWDYSTYGVLKLAGGSSYTGGLASTLNTGGHTLIIKNLSIDGVVSAVGSYGTSSVGGLFGISSGGGVLTFESCEIKNISILGGYRSGCVIGQGSSGATFIFRNSSFSSLEIRGDSANIGGLLGFSTNGDLEVLGCVLDNISIDSASGNGNGGVVGYVWGKCKFSVKDTVINDVRIHHQTKCAGGMIGLISGDTGMSYDVRVDIEGCMVTNSHIYAANYVAGLIGACDKGKSYIRVNNTGVEYSTFETAGDMASGLIGKMTGSIQEHSEVNNSYVYRCAIKSSRSSSTVYLGGMVGNDQEGIDLKNSWVSESKIATSGSGEGIGGMKGRCVAGSMVDNCTVTGVSIESSGSYVGGIIGITDAPCDVEIRSSGVVGCKIMGTDYLGGIYGAQTKGNITFSGEPSVRNSWVDYGTSYGGSYCGMLSSREGKVYHYNVWSEEGHNLELSTKAWDNRWDALSTYEKAKAAGVGSVLDIQNLQEGVDYGYRGSTYAVTVASVSHGQAAASVDYALAGEEVTLTAVPDYGYRLDSWAVTKTDGTSAGITVAGDSFTMPAYAVKVTPTFVLESTAPGTKVPKQVTDPQVDVFRTDGTHGIETVTGPAYLITCEEEWRYVVANQASYLSSTFVLANDIVFTQPVKALGKSGSVFDGKIYGNGSWLINFVFDTTGAETGCGLVGSAGDGSLLNYVRMTDSAIECSNACVGALVGRIIGDSEAETVLIGCSVRYTNITGTDSVGGVLGMIYANTPGVSLRYCDVDFSCVNSTSSSNGNVGGIMGSSNGLTTLVIDNCTVRSSDVRSSGGNTCIGGIIGNQTSKTQTTSVANCRVSDTKLWGYRYMGGVLGDIASGNQNPVNIVGCVVENSTLNATHTTDSETGGILGHWYTGKGYSTEGAVSYVNRTWVNGDPYAKPLSGNGFNSSKSLLQHYSVCSNVVSTASSDPSDNNFDFLSTYEAALAVGIGSVIDKQNLVAGVDYGYRGKVHAITIYVSSGEDHGSIYLDVSAAPAYTTVCLNAIPDDGYSVAWKVTRVDTGETVPVSSDGTFTMPASDVQVAAEFLPQTGTVVTVANADGTYSQKVIQYAKLIGSEEDWLEVVADPSLWDKTLVLTQDIRFTQPVASIGTSDFMFTGTIYGNGFRFMNFTQSGADAHGLIYYAGDGCTLNYVQMTDSRIMGATQQGTAALVGRWDGGGNCAFTGCEVRYTNVSNAGFSTGQSAYVGGIVGLAKDSGDMLIERCLVEDCVLESTARMVGGIIGYNDWSSLRIQNSSVVSCSVYAADGRAGGIWGSVGYVDTVVTNVSAIDDVISGKEVNGGLGGEISCSSSSITIQGCSVVRCSISGYDSAETRVGGLLGQSYGGMYYWSGLVESCVSDVWVNGSTAKGSLSGKNVNGSDTHFSHTRTMSNSGSISTKATDNKFDGVMTYEEALAAGIGSVIDQQHLVAGVHYGYRGTPYVITVSESELGSVSTNMSTGVEGSIVQISVGPISGYHVESIVVTSSSGTVPVSSDGAFTMPADDVVISVTYVAGLHAHNSIVFESFLLNSTTKITESGNYVLSSDVTLGDEITIGDGSAEIEVNICLDGYNLTAAEDKRIFNVTKNATLTLSDCRLRSTGGLVHNGTVAGNGSAVMVNAGGAFNMTSGTITGFTSGNGSVYVASGAIFGVSGSPVISGNPGGNIYLASGAKVTVADQLLNGARLSVNTSAPGVGDSTFTSGWSTKMDNENPANYFVADTGTKLAAKESGGSEVKFITSNGYALVNGTMVNITGDRIGFEGVDDTTIYPAYQERDNELVSGYTSAADGSLLVLTIPESRTNDIHLSVGGNVVSIPVVGYTFKHGSVAGQGNVTQDKIWKNASNQHPAIGELLTMVYELPQNVKYAAVPTISNIGGLKYTPDAAKIKVTDAGTEVFNSSGVEADGREEIIITSPSGDSTKNYQYTFTGKQLGDVNRDGSINDADLQVITNYILEETSSWDLSDDQLMYGDIKTSAGKGKVSLADLRALTKYVNDHTSA